MPRCSTVATLVTAALFFACSRQVTPTSSPTPPPPLAVSSPAPPPPASATPAPPPAPAPAPDPAPAASANPPAEPSTELGRSQKPLDMITARDAAFLIDYANSAPKQAAQTACEKESAGDPAKMGACLTKAREAFQPDVLRFRKDSETQTSLVVYKRAGSTLRELAIAAVTLSEEGDTVRVKFGGRYKGARPIWRGRPEGTLRVPNDYSIEIDDPDLGHLRYDAKIGLVTE
ncbi:MAG TPA: hypothetical protein VGK73_34735 [Polyangiaceae bacterium]